MVDPPAGEAPIHIRDSTVTVVAPAAAPATATATADSSAGSQSSESRWLFVREIRSWEARLVGYGVILLGVGNLIMAILNHLDS